ncbi:MAG: protein kinase domain-containing protein [Pyrinomonadaceae bacterium]
MKELSLNNCRLDRRYDIQQLLGRGSYAEIYVARDVLASPQSPHSSVVIKALNVFLQDDLDPELERTLVENFQNEALALDLVRHPNIISRLGHGTARDLDGTTFHYLVLEYLAGGDLQKLCRAQKIDIRTALGYIEQVCAGLRHAHEKGVIHRDIKPQNLLLTKDRETVKIADFGVARLGGADSPITRVGTNIYAPPEHSPMLNASATAARLTPAADLYSLAKSMYTIITGETPRYFSNQPIGSLPIGVRDEPWAGELLELLRKATRDEPSERFQSVDEFWIGMTKLREIACETTAPRLAFAGAADLPQPHVARGYTPLAPVRPNFESTGSLRLRDPHSTAVPSVVTRDISPPAFGVGRSPASPIAVGNGEVRREPIAIGIDALAGDAPVVRRDKRRALRRAALFFASVVLLGGVLYGTGSMLRGRGYLPQISNPWRQQTATANTDIFLRPEPNTNNDPIGLVTKNSKVRIVNSQNNWYQVDVVEQGRQRASANLTATRGWLNGKYIDIDD